MKVILIDGARKVVTFEDVKYPFSCVVRTAQNGLRPLHNPLQVHVSTNADGSDGKPVMPAVFPSGMWNVIDVVPGNNGDLGPVVIRTDAHQGLRVWTLDAAGGYDHETLEVVEDWGYELHADLDPRDGIYSVGCMHAMDSDTILEIAAAVRAALDDGPVGVSVA